MQQQNNPPRHVIIDGTTPANLLRTESGFVSCHLCGKTGPTITEHKIGMLSHLAALMTCFTGCGAGCCLVPYCMDSCLDVHHKCSSCRQPLGTYKKI